MILNKVFCTSGPNLVTLAWTSDKLWCRQAQNRVNFDFQVKFDLEGQSRLLPKTIGTSTKVFCILGPNLVILAWTGPELSRAQASDWYTHTDTNRCRQRQYPKGKPTLGKNSNCKIVAIAFKPHCVKIWLNKHNQKCVYLTHWGRVTHICVSKLTIIGSDNGLSPGRRQAIIWTKAGLLLIGPLGTNFSEILIKIITFSLKKMRLKVSSAKRRPFCLGLNVLMQCIVQTCDRTGPCPPLHQILPVSSKLHDTMVTVPKTRGNKTISELPTLLQNYVYRLYDLCV